MKKRYHLEYIESRQTFTDMYRLYFDSRSLYVYKLVIAIAAMLVLFIQLTIDRSVISALYVVKFLLVLALAFVAGHFIVKYLIRGVDARKAEAAGEKNYEKRREKFGTELLVSVDFYDENFAVSFQDQKKEYTYKEVSRLLESDQYYGLVVGGVYGNKEMVGFPASCLSTEYRDKLLSYVAGKCQNVAKGFRKLW